MISHLGLDVCAVAPRVGAVILPAMRFVCARQGRQAFARGVVDMVRYYVLLMLLVRVQLVVAIYSKVPLYLIQRDHGWGGVYATRSSGSGQT